jgi:hypothetical protein
MNDIDREEERRFAETYGRLADEQLARLAGEAHELTASATAALRAEIDRRHLPIDLNRDSPGNDEAEFQPQTMIRRFRDLPEALLAKGSLESAGIECNLWDENLVRMDWFWSNMIGGIRLMVAPADAQAADEILSQPIPEDLQVPDIGDYHQPRCPKCNSLEVSYRELNKPVAYISMYLNMPIPLEHVAWRCEECHAEWEDDQDEAAKANQNPA